MRLTRLPKQFFALLGPVLFVLVLLLPAPAGMPPVAQAVLAGNVVAGISNTVTTLMMLPL